MYVYIHINIHIYVLYTYMQSDPFSLFLSHPTMRGKGQRRLPASGERGGVHRESPRSDSRKAGI